MKRWSILWENLHYLLHFPKSPPAHQYGSLSMLLCRVRCCSDCNHGVPTSVTMSDSFNTSEITLAKYRSTAASSKLMSSLVSKDSWWNIQKRAEASCHLNRAGLKETRVTICLWSQIILLTLWRTMLSGNVSRRQSKNNTACVWSFSDKHRWLIPWRSDVPLASGEAEETNSTKWRFLCNALSNGWSLVIILLRS